MLYRAHIRPGAHGPPDRGSKSTVPPEGRPAFRLIVNTAEKPCAFVRGSPAHSGTGAFSRRAAFERAVCRIRAKNRFRLIFTFLFPARRIRDKACFSQKGATPSRPAVFADGCAAGAAVRLYGVSAPRRPPDRGRVPAAWTTNAGCGFL